MGVWAPWTGAWIGTDVELRILNFIRVALWIGVGHQGEGGTRNIDLVIISWTALCPQVVPTGGNSDEKSWTPSFKIQPQSFSNGIVRPI